MTSEASERTMVLLQELALIDETEPEPAIAAQRRKEISDELKRIAEEKNHSNENTT